MKDGGSLESRMKTYESLASQTLIPMLPVCIRVDGRCFSRLTKHFDRPFDHDFIEAMDATALVLAEEVNADVVYSQSDEISLVIIPKRFDKPIYFAGKVQKIVSTLASKAAIHFYKYLHSAAPSKVENRYPTFDCRVWNVPSLDEAVNVIVWREQDCHRNSIQQLAYHHFPVKSLHKMNQADLEAKLNHEGLRLSSRERYGNLLVKREKLFKHRQFPLGGPVRASDLLSALRELFPHPDTPEELSDGSSYDYVIEKGQTVKFALENVSRYSVTLTYTDLEEWESEVIQEIGNNGLVSRDIFVDLEMVLRHIYRVVQGVGLTYEIHPAVDHVVSSYRPFQRNVYEPLASLFRREHQERLELLGWG